MATPACCASARSNGTASPASPPRSCTIRSSRSSSGRPRPGHGGGGFFACSTSSSALSAPKPPYLDVYTGVQMTSLGILVTRAATGGLLLALEVPGFRKRKDLQALRDSTWSTRPGGRLVRASPHPVFWASSRSHPRCASASRSVPGSCARTGTGPASARTGVLNGTGRAGWRAAAGSPPRLRPLGAPGRLGRDTVIGEALDPGAIGVHGVDVGGEVHHHQLLRRDGAVLCRGRSRKRSSSHRGRSRAGCRAGRPCLGELAHARTIRVDDADLARSEGRPHVGLGEDDAGAIGRPRRTVVAHVGGPEPVHLRGEDAPALYEHLRRRAGRSGALDRHQRQVLDEGLPVAARDGLAIGRHGRVLGCIRGEGVLLEGGAQQATPRPGRRG